MAPQLALILRERGVIIRYLYAHYTERYLAPKGVANRCQACSVNKRGRRLTVNSRHSTGPGFGVLFTRIVNCGERHKSSKGSIREISRLVFIENGTCRDIT
jgi:hypothetical protein